MCRAVSLTALSSNTLRVHILKPISRFRHSTKILKFSYIPQDLPRLLSSLATILHPTARRTKLRHTNLLVPWPRTKWCYFSEIPHTIVYPDRPPIGRFGMESVDDDFMLLYPYGLYQRQVRALSQGISQWRSMRGKVAPRQTREYQRQS